MELRTYLGEVSCDSVTDFGFSLRTFVDVLHLHGPFVSSIEGRVAAFGGSTSTHFPYISAHTFEPVNS